MLRVIISIIIVILIWIIESYCAKLKNPLWGGILPLLVLGSSIYILATGLIEFNFTSFVIFFILNSSIIAGWIESREKYKKRQKEELERMKVKDIYTKKIDC